MGGGIEPRISQLPVSQPRHLDYKYREHTWFWTSSPTSVFSLISQFQLCDLIAVWSEIVVHWIHYAEFAVWLWKSRQRISLVVVCFCRHSYVQNRKCFSLNLVIYHMLYCYVMLGVELIMFIGVTVIHFQVEKVYEHFFRNNFERKSVWSCFDVCGPYSSNGSGKSFVQNCASKLCS